MAYKQHHKFSLEILPKKTFLVYLANEKLGNCTWGITGIGFAHSQLGEAAASSEHLCPGQSLLGNIYQASSSMRNGIVWPLAP